MLLTSPATFEQLREILRDMPCMAVLKDEPQDFSVLTAGESDPTKTILVGRRMMKEERWTYHLFPLSFNPGRRARTVSPELAKRKRVKNLLQFHSGPDEGLFAATRPLRQTGTRML